MSSPHSHSGALTPAVGVVGHRTSKEVIKIKGGAKGGAVS